jgi:uncharacterized protein YwqG
MEPITAEMAERPCGAGLLFTKDSRLVGFPKGPWFSVCDGSAAPEPKAANLHIPTKLSANDIKKQLKLDWCRCATELSEGQVLVGLFEGSFKLYDLETGRQMKLFDRRGVQYVEDIILTPDRKLAISHCCCHSGGRNQIDTVRFTDLVTGREYPLLKQPPGKYFDYVALSPDGATVVTSSDCLLQIWRLSKLLSYLATQDDPEAAIAAASAKLRDELLSVECRCVRLASVFQLEHGGFPAQAAFETSDSGKLWRILAGRQKPPRMLTLKLRRGRKLLDVMPMDPGLMIHERVLALFRQRGFRGWQTIAVKPLFGKGRSSDGRYYALRVTGTVEPIVEDALEKSRDYRPLVDLRTWDGSDIFRPRDSCTCLVTERVVNALTEAGITGWVAENAVTRKKTLAPLPRKRGPVSASSPAKPEITGRRPPLTLLDKLIKRHGLRRVANTIKGSVMLAASFTTRDPVKGTTAVGASRIGGVPDLASLTEWPRSGKGPLMFLGQLRLEDVAHLVENDLPHAGVLSLFVAVSGTMQWWDVEYGSGCVLYHSTVAGLAPMSPPPELPDYLTLDPRSLVLRPTVSLPHGESKMLSNWHLSDDELDSYMDLLEQLEGMNRIAKRAHQIGGYPQWLDCDQSCKEGSTTVSQRLLLQVDTDTAIGVNWGSDGRLYVFVPERDLQARRFNSAWMVQQFG